jgi:hypothetical protein
VTDEKYEHASIGTAPDPRSIAELPEGVEAYTLPWALMAAEDGSLYIRGDYPWEVASHGTFAFPICRVDGRIVVYEAPKGRNRPDRGDVSHAIRQWAAEPVYVQSAPDGLD